MKVQLYDNKVDVPINLENVNLGNSLDKKFARMLLKHLGFERIDDDGNEIWIRGQQEIILKPIKENEKDI